MMGPMEIPSQSSEAIKIPTAHYEFGANESLSFESFTFMVLHGSPVLAKPLWKGGMP